MTRKILPIHFKSIEDLYSNISKVSDEFSEVGIVCVRGVRLDRSQQFSFSKRLGTIYGNISYVNYGSFFGADKFGNETGAFSANDISITIGYCYKIP